MMASRLQKLRRDAPKGPPPYGAQTVTDRAKFDAKAWLRGEIAGMPMPMSAFLGAALRRLSARRPVLSVSTSEI